jgi:peptidoglycan/LPS O-acetylase OafA/YrhL
MALENKDSRIEVIEPLRGVAAIAVAWFHFTNGGALLKDGWLKSSGAYGWVGVEVFFVISGFVIPYSMYLGGFKFPQDVGAFLLKRVIRLDPPYLIGIGLSLGLWYVSAALPGFQGVAPHPTWAQVIAHFGYMNAFLGYDWLSPVFWTLAIEFQFYLLAAFIFPIVSHRFVLVRVIAIVCLSCAGYLVKDRSLVFHFGSLFALGILTFQFYAGLLSWSVYLLLAVMVSYTTITILGAMITAITVTTACAIAFIRVKRYPFLAFLGAISYSVYLVHVPIGGRVVNFGARYNFSIPIRMLFLAAALGVTLFAACVMYRLVEKPARRWSSSIRYARTGQAAEIVAVPTSVV